MKIQLNKIITFSLIIGIISCIGYFTLAVKDETSTKIVSIVQKQADYLFPIETEGKYGYIDNKGKEIVKPQYEEVFPFSEGLAAVKINNKFGYINTKGNFVIQPELCSAQNFLEGLALVSPDCVSKYFINNQGLKVIENKQIDFINSFDDGLASGFLFKEGEQASEQIVFVNKNGEILLDLSKLGYYSCGEELICRNFSQEFLAVNDRKLYLEKNIYKWGFIDKKGTTIVKPKYEYVHDFSDNLAAVEVNGKYGYLNKQGKEVIKPQYDDAKDFSEGLAAVLIKDRWGFIDISGEMVIKPEFYDVKNFSNGVAAVAMSINTWGYINKKGELIIQPQFDEAESFKNDLAKVSSENKNGYINKNGEFIWSNISKKQKRSLNFEKTNINALDEYINNVTNNINKNWNPPKSDHNYSITILFNIDKDGYPTNIEIENSSGDDNSDNAAIDAVNKAAPLIPYPKEFNINEDKISITLKYNSLRVGE
ncbi:MAG TPA: TonB family protein [Candidatus Gastranaerophilales bacterium]|nr:TonB family protein [Candidatus Gastranaerophilales bacterium]